MKPKDGLILMLFLLGCHCVAFPFLEDSVVSARVEIEIIVGFHSSDRSWLTCLTAVRGLHDWVIYLAEGQINLTPHVMHERPDYIDVLFNPPRVPGGSQYDY